MKGKFDFSKPPPRPETEAKARALLDDLRAELVQAKARRKLEKRLQRLLREHDIDDV